MVNDLKIYTVEEVAKLLGMGKSTLSKKIQKHKKIDGIYREGKYTRITSQAIPELKKILSYNNDFDKAEYLSTKEVSLLLNEKGLEAKRIHINNWIRSRKVESILHMGYRYVIKSSFDSLYELLLVERTIPEGYCTVEVAANLVNVHPGTIKSWSLSGDLESQQIIIDGYWQTVVRKDALVFVKQKSRLSALSALSNFNVFSKETVNKKTTKVNSPGTKLENHEYVKAVSASKILNVKISTIYAYMKEGKFPTSYKEKNIWFISANEIEEHKIVQLQKKDKKISNQEILDSKNNPLGYLQSKQILKKLNVSSINISTYIKSGHFPSAIKIKNKWFVKDTDIDNYLAEKKLKTKANDLHITDKINRKSRESVLKINKDTNFPLRQNAKVLGFNQMEMQHLIDKEVFTNPIHISSKWNFPINEFELVKESAFYQEKWERYFPTGYLQIKQIIKKLSVSSINISIYIKLGHFPSAIKINNRWFVKETDVDNYLANKQMKTKPESKSDLIIELIKIIKSNTLNENIPETLLSYQEFCKTKLNATNGREVNWRRVFGHLNKVFNSILLPLSNELILISPHEIENVILSKEFSSPVRELFLQFIRYSFDIKGVKQDKQYNVSRKNKLLNKDPNDERYSPEVYQKYEQYVKNIHLHSKKSLKRRDYANMWLYVSMLLSNAWRPSDIIFEMPHIDLTLINISGLDWFEENSLSVEQCQLIINQLHMRLNQSRASKSNALLNFLVPPDMIEVIATSSVISELHCQSINKSHVRDKNLLLGSFISGRTDRTANAHTTGKKSHLKFFGDNKELLPFGSRKLNNSTMTYLYFEITENVIDSPELALELPKWTRSHKEIESTAIYVKATNKDGSIDRVSINLFKRGHFGWLYNLLIQMAFTKSNSHQNMEERTNSIESLRKDYTPIEIEAWAKSMIESRSKRNETINHIYKMHPDELKIFLAKIFTCKMPSRDGNGQCIVYPDCRYPQRKTCIGCENFIPQFQYVMLEAASEFHRLVSSIREVQSKILLKRDSFYFLNLLLLFNEAAMAFGKEALDGFISKEDRESAIREISDKLIISVET